MRPIFLLICTLLFAFPAQAGSHFFSLFAGEWQGVGLQSDGSDWSILVSLEPEQAIITYPSLDCGGNWQYVNISETGLAAIETIEYGLQNCIETGNVYLKPFDENKIVFIWCDTSLELVAFAILERTGLGPRSYAAQRATSLEALETPSNHLKNISCPADQWLGV